MKSFLLSIILLSTSLQLLYAQADGIKHDSLVIDFSSPKEYTIAAISITGTQYLDKDILIALSGINVGDKIDLPSEEIGKAIKNLWKQNLFANIKIYVDHTDGTNAYLTYALEERPRLSGFTFRGIKKSEQDDIREKINLNKGRVLTDNVRVNTLTTIKGFYEEKGYSHAKVTIRETPDSSQQNSMLYYIYVDKGNRVKIDDINFSGNEAVSDGKLHRLMKKTKENSFWSVFTVSKFRESDYEDDKTKILAFYSTKGYRDAHILSDTVYKNDRVFELFLIRTTIRPERI